MLKKCGLCCLGSMRMILFFICMFTVISQAIGLIILICIGSQQPDLVFRDSIGFKILNDFLFLVIFAIGAYGTFHNDESSIMGFAIAMAGYTLISFVELVFILSSNVVEQVSKRLFKMAMKAYKPSEGVSGPNIFIDMIQKTNHCCGFEGPSDWHNVTLNYPTSCCESSVGGCKGGEVFKQGCEQFVATTAKLSLYTFIFMFAFQLLITVMAFLVARCRKEQQTSNNQLIVRTDDKGNLLTTESSCDNHQQWEQPGIEKICQVPPSYEA